MLFDAASLATQPDFEPHAVPHRPIAPVLCFHPRELDAVRRMAAGSWPEEVGGLLVGAVGPGVVRVQRVTLVRSSDRERLRGGAVVPAAHWLAEDAIARAQGLRVVGVWIARPDRQSRPYSRAGESVRDGAALVFVPTTEGGAGRVESLWMSGATLVEQKLRTLDTDLDILQVSA